MPTIFQHSNGRLYADFRDASRPPILPRVTPDAPTLRPPGVIRQTNPGCWSLVTGCWLLVIGYWVLVTGYWSSYWLLGVGHR
jgi:hypothetical protein